MDGWTDRRHSSVELLSVNLILVRLYSQSPVQSKFTTPTGTGAGTYSSLAPYLASLDVENLVLVVI